MYSYMDVHMNMDTMCVYIVRVCVCVCGWADV